MFTGVCVHSPPYNFSLNAFIYLCAKTYN
uniref:Uncharacterized protein n=1 Tax=Anguilla anguilla TaxID=7936 RepID=A0A0E9SC58_ANGAN